MSSCGPAYKRWFGERGVPQGVGLDVLFSGRGFDTPEHLFSQNETQQCQQAKFHYAVPRAPPRPVHSWGTYSPPPPKPHPRPASLDQCHGYRAHTLPLPRRALAVFKPCIYSSPQGYRTLTVEKPCMLRATITSSSSDSNHPHQDQSQGFQQQSKLSQQQFIKQQQLPSLTPQTVYQPSFTPQTVHQPSFSPQTVYQPSFSPQTVYKPSHSPKTVHHPSHSPQTVYKPSHSPKTVHHPSHSPQTVLQPIHSPKTVHHPSHSPQTVYKILPNWQHKVNTVTGSSTTETHNSTHCNNIKRDTPIRQVDMTSQNVFGQPRVMALLRSPPSPRQTHTDRNIEEALKRLIILDNTSEDSMTDASCSQSLSTEISLDKCPSDFSQACSPVSDCPELEALRGLSASELSLTEGWDPGHTPPPEPGWSLEWSNLVNASQVYEESMAVDPVSPSKSQRHGSEGGPPNQYLQGYNVQPTLSIPESRNLADRLHHLEVLLRCLEGNLDKERHDKVALMEEVTILRETNQRLWEESFSSNEQLRKLSVLFNVAPGMMPRERMTNNTRTE